MFLWEEGRKPLGMEVWKKGAERMRKLTPISEVLGWAQKQGKRKCWGVYQEVGAWLRVAGKEPARATEIYRQKSLRLLSVKLRFNGTESCWRLSAICEPWRWGSQNPGLGIPVGFLPVPGLPGWGQTRLPRNCLGEVLAASPFLEPVGWCFTAH